MANYSINEPMSDPSKWLKREVVDKIRDKAWSHSKRNFLLIEMLLRTGRRIGELLELKPKDISWSDGTILWKIEKKYKYIKDGDGNMISFLGKDGKYHYKTQKKNYRRYKAVDDETLDALREYISEENLDDDDYVFYSPFYGKKSPITRIAVWKFMSKYADELGFDIHPHIFRHTFSVWMAKSMENPNDLKKLSDLLEHSDIKITESYLQFSTKESKDLLKKTFSSGKED